MLIDIHPRCCSECPCYREEDYSYHTGGGIYQRCKAGSFDIKGFPHEEIDERCPGIPLDQKDSDKLKHSMNLNENIKVRLTDFGKDIYYHQYDKLNNRKGRVVCEPRMPKVDADGYTKFQLWEFMRVYGKYMHIGTKEVIKPLQIFSAEEDDCVLSLADVCYAFHLADIGEFSDGYHTFNSLYEQRMFLFATIVNQNQSLAWKSHKHSDGNECFGGGWFIVGVDTPEGGYTYHYKNEYWDLFHCQELEHGKEWDGHTEKDVGRLLSIIPKQKES